MENVKNIEGFEGYYISTSGEIFTAWDGHVKPGTVLKKMKLHKRPNGYLMVSMHGGGRKKSFSRLVHRLVLEAFVGVRPDGMECRHINGVPTDNQLDNLAWGTSSENLADKIKHGKNLKNAKLNSSKVKLIRLLVGQFGWSLRKTAHIFGVHKSTISYIKSGKIWRFV